MSVDRFVPRRPAMLDFEEAEQIIGDEDPAITTNAAVTSARAVLGFSDTDFNEAQVSELIHAISVEGVDLVSALWSRSAPLSLPGQMWRLYLLREWMRRDPEVVQQRYDEGVVAISQARPELVDSLPTLESVRKRLETVMSGGGVDDLPELLRDAGRLMRVLAAGASFDHEWIKSDASELADQVTLRAKALLKTSDEFLQAAKLAEGSDFI